MKSSTRIFLFVLAAGVGWPAFAAPILYTVVPVAGPGSNAFAINSSGDVTGVFETPGGASHAFLFFQANGFLDLGTLAGGNSIGRDIEDGGVVVGQSDGRAFKYEEFTGMVGLDTGNSDARSISNAGNITLGTVYSSSSTSTMWNGINTPMPYFITENTEGYGINDAVEFVGRVDGVVGYYCDGSSNVSYTDLGLFLPTDISNSRKVSGSESGIAGYYDSVSQTFLPFGTLDVGDTVSEALSLNNLNMFVGYSGNGSDSKGFLWDQINGFTDLTAHLVPGFEQWTVISANGINDYGYITGQVRYQGIDYAAILKPAAAVPEVSALGLSGATVSAAAALLLRRQRRRGLAYPKPAQPAP